MSFDKSKNIINKLLKDIKTREILLTQSEDLRDDLNADIKKIDSSFESFSGTTDSNEVNEELKNIFFNSNPTLGFQFKTMKSGDIIIFNIQSINKIKEVEKDDNYKDFINFSKNTYSESDFDRVFRIFKDNSVIDIDNETLYQD